MSQPSDSYMYRKTYLPKMFFQGKCNAQNKGVSQDKPDKVRYPTLGCDRKLLALDISLFSG